MTKTHLHRKPTIVWLKQEKNTKAQILVDQAIWPLKFLARLQKHLEPYKNNQHNLRWNLRGPQLARTMLNNSLQTFISF